MYLHKVSGLLAIVLAALLQLLSVGAVAEPTEPFACKSGEFEPRDLRVEGIVRRYCLHIPDQSGPLPLVIAFHGANGTAASMVNMWRQHTESSMIIAAPQALGTRRHGVCIAFWRQVGDVTQTWDALAEEDTCTGGSHEIDLKFAAALMDEIAALHPVSGIYATGFSNGADFIFQLVLTRELAQRIDGFATAGAGMVPQKLRAARAGGAVAGFSVNTDLPRPFLVEMGTADRKNILMDEIAEVIDADGGCGVIASAHDVRNCFYRGMRTSEGGSPFDIGSRLSRTRDWLTAMNRSDPDRRESLYPDLGRGTDGDRTMTVREDYDPRPGSDGAAVAILTTIDGGHTWPGWGGNRPPCGSHNCDIDLTREAIQFWRTHAGMKLPPPR